MFFEHVRERIEPQLEALGFLLAEERYVPGSFGSALAVYHRPGTRFRLVWDGKERALSGAVASDRGNAILGRGVQAKIQSSIGKRPKIA